MATNYLSASLLSDTYGTMLTADDRENERQILYAFENARVSGSQITPENMKEFNLEYESYFPIFTEHMKYNS